MQKKIPSCANLALPKSMSSPLNNIINLIFAYIFEIDYNYFKANKTNSFVRFFGENLRRAHTTFGFIWSLLKYFIIIKPNQENWKLFKLFFFENMKNGFGLKQFLWIRWHFINIIRHNDGICPGMAEKSSKLYKN